MWGNRGQAENRLSNSTTKTTVEEIPSAVRDTAVECFEIMLLSHDFENLLFSDFSENAENMYYFSSLALSLNEPEDGVAPTDSRLRPDQRMMEAGLWDEANTEKQRLEERQRLERRKKEAQANLALEEGMRELQCLLIMHCSIIFILYF